ncbi:unnamed protein product, partial [Vitis vinifera]
MNFLFFIFGKQLAKYLYFYKTLKNYFFFFNLKTIFKTKYKKTWLKWVISLQRQASLTIAQALSEKTVEEVWSDIQQGEKKKCGDDIKGQVREPTLGEMKLEDFLVKAAVFVKGLDIVGVVTPPNFPQQMGLSPSPSVGTLSDTSIPGHERDASMEKTVERRLKRKIKNRESAARSRARKQAYHNELVSKVSRLEEENVRLKKEKEVEKMFPCESSTEPKYQLRRTSSVTF